MKIKCDIYRDSFQNFKGYNIPRAQLIIADIPYCVGNNFYGSNPMWYQQGDNKNGESKLAGKAAFSSDFHFNLYEYFHFCAKMLKKEDTKPVQRGRSSDSPCMIVFCAFEQIQTLIKAAEKHGFVHYIPLVFCKHYSPQVLKANMRVVGATEYALLLYRDRLPKFRNGAQTDRSGKTIPNTGRMVFNWFEWQSDGKGIPKIHPAQKPVAILKRLIEIFTDEGDVVIDPCCGSGATLRAAAELGRSAYGFEIDRNFYKRAKEEMLAFERDGQMSLFNGLDGSGRFGTETGQLSLFDYMETLASAGDYEQWTVLEPRKGEYCFPENTAEWRQIECRVQYQETGKETTELYEYKDFTFRSVGKWSPEMGHGSRIVAWRELWRD